MAAFILFIVFIVLLVLFISSFVKIVPQSEAFVIERLGAYNRTLDVGLHILVPFIERVANRVSLKEQVMDFDPQPVITKDNVTMQIDTVVYFKVFDPKLFTYGVVNPINAVDSLTSTTLRNIIGDLNLDDTLTSRDTINAQMSKTLFHHVISRKRWKNRCVLNVRSVKQFLLPKEKSSLPSCALKVKRKR